MNKQVLQDWLQDRLERISMHACSVQPGYYPEPIHHMRTETKRLRALLRLLSFQCGNDFRLPGSYRKLYRIAGSIRDPQVHLQELFAAGLPRLPMFSLWLAQTMAPGIRKWEQKFEEAALDPLKKSLQQLPLPELELIPLLDYFRMRRGEIAGLLQTDPDDEALHQIRKWAKDLLYILAFCEKRWAEAWKLLEPLEAVLKRLSDRAGAFNDKRNLLDAVHQFQEEYMDHLEAPDREACEKAIVRWSHQKEQARKRLMITLRALLHRRIPRGFVGRNH